jgi:hypothetical protein
VQQQLHHARTGVVLNLLVKRRFVKKYVELKRQHRSFQNPPIIKGISWLVTAIAAAMHISTVTAKAKKGASPESSLPHCCLRGTGLQ